MCSAVVPQQPPTMLIPSSRDEALEPAGELVGAQRVVRVAAAQLGQAGVGQAGDQAAPGLREMADVLGHLLGAGGAVEAHHRHAQRVDDGGGGGDVGADQHGAGGLDRDLHHERQLAAAADEGVAAAVDRGLDLQRVLAGLDQERVGAAGDQALGLDRERRLQLAVADVAEARQLGAGADGADDEALAAVAGEGLDRLAREPGGALVDLERPLLEAELAQRDRRAAEAVGLDRVGAGGEVAALDLADQVGAAEVQDLRAVLLAPDSRRA